MTERDQFEAWLLSEGYPRERLKIRISRYVDDHIDDLWSGWEARAGFAAPSASAEQPDLHSQIMNLPCVTPQDYFFNEKMAYKAGHRDARHAAAGFAAAACAAVDFAANHMTPDQAAKGAK
jgi:hypothetical protein